MMVLQVMQDGGQAVKGPDGGLFCPTCYGRQYIFFISYNIICYKSCYARYYIFLYFNHYKFCYFRHFGHMGRASADGRMVMATNGKVVNVGSRGCCFFFPRLSKFIIALYSSVIQK